MNWKKRTEAEIDESVAKKDYTGGYEWWPWLWYMRKMYVLGFLVNLSFGIAGFTIFTQDSEWTSFGIGCFFGLFTSPLIGFLIRRDFKESKKGISR